MITGDPLSGPAGAGALFAAVQWLQGTLLGTLATTVAVIAIAWIGIGMLTGRIEIRRGAIVVLGCFVVFGAPAIVAGLMRIGEGSATPVPPTTLTLVPRPVFITPTPTPYDPYAGASVPNR